MPATARKRVVRRRRPTAPPSPGAAAGLAYVARRLRAALDPSRRRHIADVRFRRLLPILLAVGVTACGVMSPLNDLARAARAGDVEVIDRLVAAGAGVDEGSGFNGWPPLLHAIHEGQTFAARRLIEHGASIDGRIGQQALTMASGDGDADSVLLLLRRGLRPSKAGTTPVQLMTAAVAGAFDRDPHWSGCDRHTDVVRVLVAHDPDLKRATPHTARRFAARRGCDEMVALLR